LLKIDKAAMDYYMRLTTFHSQFRAIGVNQENPLIRKITVQTLAGFSTSPLYSTAFVVKTKTL
jgi:hypothetical protein